MIAYQSHSQNILGQTLQEAHITNKITVEDACTHLEQKKQLAKIEF